MRERVIYLGPFNNGKQKELINKAVDHLKDNRGREFYYLLPNGELLKKYRQDFVDQSENTFEINVFTFDDIVDQVLKNQSNDLVDNPMKNLIIGEVLNELDSQGMLDYYKNFGDVKGFIHSLNDIIGEIKRSLIYPEEYLSRCPKKPQYKEIGLIYKAYEDMLNELNLWDREGAYFKSIEILKEENFLKDLEFIIIDEFYDFRPIELAILKELVKSDLNIYINMPFDMENRSLILGETLEILKELGFTIEYIEKEDKNLFEEIGLKLFSEAKDVFESKEELKIINAPTPYLELRRIFEEVKRLHKEGTDLENIGIILTNPEYKEALFKLAKEEKVPISMDKALSLRYLPMARELLGILENKISNGNKFKLVNRIKSRYFSICPKEKKEIYEYIIRKQNFNDINDIKSLLHSGQSLNIPMDHLENLRGIVQIVEEEFADIPKKAKVQDYNNYILEMIDKLNIKQNILIRFQETKKQELLLRDLRSINMIQEILEKIESSPLFQDEISLEKYYLILEEYLEEEEIIEVEGNPKGLHILNPVNSRGSIKDALFITGMSQGSYPSLDNNSYFINEYNLKELREIGIDLKSYMESLNNEILKFSSMVASARERIYFSYSRGNSDAAIPSIFLDELLELIKPKDDKEQKLEEIHIDLGYLIKRDISHISNNMDLTRYLLFKYFNEDKLSYSIHTSHAINKKIQGEIQRNKEEFNEYNGLLQGDEILRDIGGKINEVFSISYLESYSTCPYYFKLNNLFNIVPLERDYEDYSPIDIGMIYHEGLRRYYQYYLDDIKEDILGNKELDINGTVDYLKKIVYEYAAQYEFNLDKKKHLLIIENIIDRLMNFIEEDLGRLRRWKLLPSEFEVDFGKLPKFTIVKDGFEIPMLGRIDRIDKFLEEDKYVVIDYKSSGYGIRDIRDMKSGLSLQLPVYIMSQEDKDVVVGAYGIISDGNLEIKLGLVEETSILTRRNMGALDKEEWKDLMETSKENIVHIIEGINKGDFSVNPLECSSYCIYKDICRYTDVLEVE